MKIPWWAIPGVATIVLTLASVSAADSAFHSAPVSLPREVQLSRGGPAEHPSSTAPAAVSPTSPAVLPAAGQPDRVVAPSRPVISQTGVPGASHGTSVAGATPTNPSTTPVSPDSGIEDSGAGNGPSADTTPAPPAPAPTGGGPSAVPSTTQPTPSTTTTTRPWRGDE